ncbi:MAG: hypothetical protein CMK09_01615 [Ponticaulis sp.]|nr:hypothetical protein [Ponticaulis sp.]|tara:strand:+ start:2321 stop:3583 length:1263 start_codon:yes stop_codon:yes gene_type:complete
MGNSQVESRLFEPGKKKCLTLDGGGTRGVITLQFLKRMETVLREETGRKDYVLSDFFDLAAGTSVGSMLATMVAMGMPTDEMDAKFMALSKKIFSSRRSFFKMNKYNATHLTNSVRSIVRNETLESDELKIGLVVITKRTDTGAVWVLSNNPRMPYWEDGSEWLGNRHYKLESIIRASTAAPVFFSAAEMNIHAENNEKGDEIVINGDFVDGGVSPHNNPSMQVLLMAGLPPYKLNWSLSPSELLMISVGTGIHRSTVNRKDRIRFPSWVSPFLSRQLKDDINDLKHAAESLRCMITDNSLYALKLMQSVSHPRFSWLINSEVGDFDQQSLLGLSGLKSEDGSMAHALLSFQRYDLPLDKRPHLDDKKHKASDFYDTSVEEHELIALQPIDEPINLDRLAELAAIAAEKQVSAEDFRAFL